MESIKRKLLIVDDDPAFGRLLSGLLGGMYDARIAISGRHALALVPEWPPDAAIVDIRLPGMCGITLIEKFRGSPALADMPILVLSVESDYNTILNAISAGSDEYHLKINFSMKTILEALDRVIESKRTAQEFV